MEKEVFGTFCLSPFLLFSNPECTQQKANMADVNQTSVGITCQCFSKTFT